MLGTLNCWSMNFWDSDSNKMIQRVLFVFFQVIWVITQSILTGLHCRRSCIIIGLHGWTNSGWTFDLTCLLVDSIVFSAKKSKRLYIGFCLVDFNLLAHKKSSVSSEAGLFLCYYLNYSCNNQITHLLMLLNAWNNYIVEKN